MKFLILLLSLANSTNALLHVCPRDQFVRVRFGQFDYAIWRDAGLWVRSDPGPGCSWDYSYYPCREVTETLNRLPPLDVCEDAIEANEACHNALAAIQACDFAHRHWQHERLIVENRHRGNAWRALRRLRLAYRGVPQYDLAEDVRLLRKAVGPRFVMPHPLAGVTHERP